MERLFSRAKEWLMLDNLRVRGLEQVFIHCTFSFTAMLAIALAVVQCHQFSLLRMIMQFTA